jgi:hypothetical protein
MSKKAIMVLLSVFLVSISGFSRADFEVWKDYEFSDEVWSVTTIKVHPNMGEDYLEGIARTWVKSNEAFKELGQIEDYAIYRSDLPASGDFNMMLVVKFANTADLAPNRKKYEAYMEKMTKKMADKNSEYAQKNYPGMREITGEYLMRKVTIK